MSATADSSESTVQLTGGGCSCGCCGPSDAEDTLSREEEIIELRRLREQTVARLEELDAEPSGS